MGKCANGEDDAVHEVRNSIHLIIIGFVWK